ISVICACLFGGPLFYASENVPMELYGRIVDEDGKGIGDAKISLNVIRGNLIDLPILFSSSPNRSKMSVLTSEDGSFVINGIRGIGLEIDDVEKRGYELADM